MGDGGEETPRGERARSEAASDMLIDSDRSRSSSPHRGRGRGEDDDDEEEEEEENLASVTFKGVRASPATIKTSGKAKNAPKGEGAASTMAVDTSSPKNGSSAKNNASDTMETA